MIKGYKKMLVGPTTRKIGIGSSGSPNTIKSDVVGPTIRPEHDADVIFGVVDSYGQGGSSAGLIQRYNNITRSMSKQECNGFGNDRYLPPFYNVLSVFLFF